MKVNVKWIIGLMIVIVLSYFWQDYQVNKWKKKFEDLKPATPDTITIYLVPKDVVIEEDADSVETEFEYVRGEEDSTGARVDTVWKYGILYDKIEQPLFSLNVICSTKTEKFIYNFDYRPLLLRLEFIDKIDLRKGFNVYTEPSIGDIKVSWEGYEPLKPAKKFKLSTGFGYSQELGPILLGGIHWKKNELGVFAKEESFGVYYKRVFVELF